MAKFFRLAIGWMELALVLVSTVLALAAGETPVVQSGETHLRIALNPGVTMEALRAADGIVRAIVHAGPSLPIPNGKAAAATG